MSTKFLLSATLAVPKTGDMDFCGQEHSTYLLFTFLYMHTISSGFTFD